LQYRCNNMMILPVPAQTATIGFSYSVAGLLFPFQAGVTNKLQEDNHLLPSTPLNGASGGSLAVACAASPTVISTEEALASSLRIANRCTKEGAIFNLERILREELSVMCTQEMVNEINARPSRVDFLWTSAPSLQRRSSGPPFDCPDDLIDILSASCHIPLYSSVNPVTSVQGEWGLDGFLSAPSALGCQPVQGVDETIFCTPFSSFPSKTTRRSLISPLVEDIPFTPAEYLSLALGRPGPNEEQHRLLFELGRKCAERWINNDYTRL